MATYGYELNKRESSANSAVMIKREEDRGEAKETQVGIRAESRTDGKKGDEKKIKGDKLIVTKGLTGFWIYFSVRDDSDHGTIIDFCQKRTGKNFGEIRKMLRLWLRNTKPKGVKPNKYKFDLKPLSKNREQVLKQLAKTSIAEKHPYLESRGIKKAIQKSSRFLASVRLDKYNNAIFPHQDELGITGFEIKNFNFMGFSRGGEKALWCSNSFKKDTKLVITESTIDAFSYAQLHPETLNNTRYISVGGTMSNKQRELIKAAMEKILVNNAKNQQEQFQKNQAEVEVIIATDNDEIGEKLADELKELAPSSKINLIRALPQDGKDWNDILTIAKLTL